MTKTDEGHGSILIQTIARDIWTLKNIEDTAPLNMALYLRSASKNTANPSKGFEMFLTEYSIASGLVTMRQGHAPLVFTT
jgi:hypothetical protein